MSVGAVNQTDMDIDLGRLVRAIWERKLAIGVVTAAAAGFAFVVTGMLDPLYKSETRVLIETREPLYSSDTRQPVNDAAFDERAVTSQVEILRSIDLAKTVARELDLSSRPEFDPAADPSVITELLVSLGLGKNPLDVPAEERVLKAFYEKLQVYAVPASRVIVIEFNSEDAALAARVPDALADAYLAFKSGVKLENNSDAGAWLEPEIARLQASLRDAEQRVAGYRAEKGLLLVNENDTLSVKQLSDISTELSRVRGERADAEARARTVRNAIQSGQSVDAIGDVLGSALVQRLRESEGAIRAQLADLSTTLLDGHPRMKALRAQLADIERQVLAETRKVLSSLESNAKLATNREEDLLGQLNTLKIGSAREGEETVELRALEREAASQRALLETYLARFRETASRSELNSVPADARVISRAVAASESFFPKTGPIIIVSALSAFLLSAIFVMLAELFSGRALRPAEGFAPDIDFDRAADAEVAGIAHPVAMRPTPAALSPQASPPDISDFSIEAVALQLMDDHTSVAICVSPEGDEGSAASVMLARVMAGEGARTLLIDLTQSGCPTELMAESIRLPGLTDLLCGEISIADAIHADRLSEAQIIPRGNANPRRAMRAVERLPMVVDSLAEAYDLVIVECGAAEAKGVARIARSRGSELILTVVRADAERLAATIRDFSAAGFPELMLMTTDMDPDSPDATRNAVA